MVDHSKIYLIKHQERLRKTLVLSRVVGYNIFTGGSVNLNYLQLPFFTIGFISIHFLYILNYHHNLSIMMPLLISSLTLTNHLIARQGQLHYMSRCTKMDS